MVIRSVVLALDYLPPGDGMPVSFLAESLLVEPFPLGVFFLAGPAEADFFVGVCLMTFSMTSLTLPGVDEPSLSAEA